MFDTIRELTAGMAAGDSRAVETFYRRYFDSMHAFAKRVMRRDEAGCMDVVQDAVLRVVRTVRTVDSDVQFRAWLRLVTQTTALDCLKAESRRKRRETAVVAGAAGGTDLSDPDSEVADQIAWLSEQVSKLDAGMVELIDMRFQKGWTLARIAQSLGLSVGTVDGRLRRALGRLREL